MSIKGRTRPSCAACKYQRRKCSSECMLAPYFPANQPKMFQNAHKLFGISNIVKILKQLDDNDQKADAMKSIIFEADMWERFPVYGCVEYICYLHQQLQLALNELHYVNAQLAIYREPHQQHLASSSSTMDSFSTSNGEFNEGGTKTLLHTTHSLFDMKTLLDSSDSSLAFPTFDPQDISRVHDCVNNPFNNIMADDRQLNVEDVTQGISYYLFVALLIKKY